MAWIVADGFDYYPAVADLARSVWDTVPTLPQLGTAASHPPRFLPGQCVYGAGTGVTWGTKVIGSNEGTIYLVCALYFEGAPSGTNPGLYLKLLDGASAQCTLVIESSGNILLKRGDQNGTTVATYSGALPQDTWQHFQFRVVIDPTIGSFTARRNGSPSDTFSATGLNTRSTANSYATAFHYGNGNAAANFVRLDDLLVFSGSGAAPNTWVGDTRAICLPPVSDSAIQFAAVPGGGLAVLPAPTPVGTFAIPPDQANWSAAVTPTRSSLVTNMTVPLTSSITGTIQAAIYYADGGGGLPGTRIAVSTPLTNPTAGTMTFVFPGGTYLSSGAAYCFALLANVSTTVTTSNAGRVFKSTSYAGGFPDPAGAVTVDAGTRFPFFTCNLTASNALMVSETLANSDTDYVASSTVAQQDLYTIAALPVVPSAILGVVTKAYLKKSDAGTRNGQVLLQSAATTVTTPDAGLSTTYTYVSRVDAVDPATSTAWTIAGVNAIKIGQKVTL
jgi:hypothetical protein